MKETIYTIPLRKRKEDINYFLKHYININLLKKIGIKEVVLAGFAYGTPLYIYPGYDRSHQQLTVHFVL